MEINLDFFKGITSDKLKDHIIENPSSNEFHVYISFGGKAYRVY